MRTEQILSADILDIVFDNRNKNYGAYDLRKFYEQRLYKAIGLMFLMVAGVVFILVYTKNKLIIKPEIPDIEMYNTKIQTLEPVQIIAPKEQPKPKQNENLASQKYISNIVITKKESDATKLAKNLDSVVISNTTQQGKPSEIAVVQGAEPGKENGTEVATVTKTVDKTTPLASAEVMPSYPGGMEGLRKFLQKNLQNPEDLEQGQIISVKVKFVVGYDGKLKSFETIEDGGKAFNNEVIRVLKRMPEWIPGKSNGENVSVYYTIPVKFTAAD